ncbi:helix-turn-helix transcriptional regulator, partial [Planktotalea sp.]|uniref:helix-turn-helix transcriptional regulator n=1 Tax=Planktotalea sp. TaxID=2029877 RepID=UPI0035C81FFE
KEHKVKIAYADARGNTSERIIWPFFISYLEGGRLISAWCEMRQEIRHFRTDRMQSLSEMEARYPRRRHDLIKEWRELETAEMPKGKQR